VCSSLREIPKIAFHVVVMDHCRGVVAKEHLFASKQLGYFLLALVHVIEGVTNSIDPGQDRFGNRRYSSNTATKEEEKGR
jgi:hypothetical protein